jgi:2-polyprenyl-3-methyl-5-hydroxy-6-metoxy-1,4-benzoquinol methylase
MNQDLSTYYNQRAAEYDKIYLNPNEQEDLLSASAFFQEVFSNKTVLEIACGTGYWTERIAKTATSVFATDINQSVLDIAKAKPINEKVSFAVADMYHFTSEQKYEVIFGGFIWSHILLQDLDNLLDKLNDLLVPNGELVFIDSHPVEHSHHDKKRITRTDDFGNTFQNRQLENGTAHEVLKNFPTRDFLVQKLSRIGTEISFLNLKHYWIVRCKVKHS